MEKLQARNMKLEIRRQLFWLLKEIQGEDHSRFVILHYEDARLLKEQGLLQPYGGFDSIDMGSDESTDTLRLLVSGQMAEGKRIVNSDGGFYTIEIAALRKVVSNLYRDDRVNENENIFKEEHKPQGQNTQWQDAIQKDTPKFRAARPNESTVSMEVKVLEPVRKASKELAAAHGMTAQQYMEHLLVDALNKHPQLLEEGKERLKQFKGSTQAVRRFAEREELARLRQLTSSPRH